MLAELHRVLASGGRLAIFTTASALPAWMTRGSVKRRMHLYTDEQLRELIAAAGFTAVTVKPGDKHGYQQLATARRA